MSLCRLSETNYRVVARCTPLSTFYKLLEIERRLLRRGLASWHSLAASLFEGQYEACECSAHALTVPLLQLAAERLCWASWRLQGPGVCRLKAVAGC